MNNYQLLMTMIKEEVAISIDKKFWSRILFLGINNSYQIV
jgi:hypothetical protein